MTALPRTRPQTPLSKACPIIGRTMDEYDKLVAAGRETEAAKIWKQIASLNEAFRAGIDFARSGGR